MMLINYYLEYENISLKVKNILKEYGISSPLEIDIEDIIYSEEIYIRKTKLSGMLGYLVKGDKNSSTLTVRDDLSPEKLRFLYAHELGHYKLHIDEKNFIDDNSSLHMFNNKNIESEANKFAAEWLVPSSLLKQDCEEAGVFSDKLANELQEKYCVSLTCLLIRLVSVDVFRFGFIRYENNNVISTSFTSKFGAVNQQIEEMTRKGFPLDTIINGNRNSSFLDKIGVYDVNIKNYPMNNIKQGLGILVLW